MGNKKSKQANKPNPPNQSSQQVQPKPAPAPQKQETVVLKKAERYIDAEWLELPGVGFFSLDVEITPQGYFSGMLKYDNIPGGDSFSDKTPEEIGTIIANSIRVWTERRIKKAYKLSYLASYTKNTEAQFTKA